MASLAQAAVLVHSAATVASPVVIRGVPPTAPLAAIVGGYGALGFQASHLARAVEVGRAMLRPRAPSKVFVIRDGAFVEVPPEDAAGDEEQRLVRPLLFVGMAANLLGTGCRDALRYLLREGVAARPAPEAERERLLQLWPAPTLEARDAAAAAAPPAHASFVGAVVVSGGGIEHDLRQACAALQGELDGAGGYRVGRYSSEDAAGWSPGGAGRFGNVRYDRHPPLFDALMERLVERLLCRQEARRTAYLQQQQQQQQQAPQRVDYTECPWATSPSEVWLLAGVWLRGLLAEVLVQVAALAPADAAARARQAAETTAVYWAAVQGVPLFSPSFADGDIMAYLLPHATPGLQLDLVRDIHALNKMAMRSRSTAMLICGGGSVKHHLCNANLMRNGADLSIFINNGMEFDGSDGGAKPEEALSWGKVRVDGDYVKVQSEVSLVLPLLVAEVFVPAVRARGAAAPPPGS
ncbi:deoxyhypusine synthase [Strigomonas culicis]|uniref:Deoxyhypusine synthase n=1 Tax=Strigomonas culicis TaxID=28005 RepID=S9US49_9TRYP|nr:deoxyhypusine synthase [Strigomonas culicis]|eukprot:EPY33777.1 deoxyhypusine synthase [Strigomonas culicis]